MATFDDRVLARFAQQTRLPREASMATRVRMYEAGFQRAVNEEICSAMLAISTSLGPHDDAVWEAAALWTLSHSDSPRHRRSIVAYLAAFGFHAVDVQAWGEVPGPSGPQLHLELDGNADALAHEEHYGHTWYMVACSLGPIPASARPTQEWQLDGSGEVQSSPCQGGRRVAWRAPRRLTQLRDALHGPVKALLGGEAYEQHFREAPFAKHFGPKGTTERLRVWLAKLAELVNGGALTPDLVAWTLAFFRGRAELEQLAGEVGLTPEASAPDMVYSVI